MLIARRVAGIEFVQRERSTSDRILLAISFESDASVISWSGFGHRFAASRTSSILTCSAAAIIKRQISECSKTCGGGSSDVAHSSAIVGVGADGTHRCSVRSC
jgi:hypothetical protein